MTAQEIKEQITDQLIIDGRIHPRYIDIDKLCEFLSTLTK